MYSQAVDDGLATVFLSRSQVSGKLRVTMAGTPKDCDAIGVLMTAKPKYVAAKVKRLGIECMDNADAMALLAIYGEVMTPVVQ